MVSAWSNPLPIEEHTATSVVICAYEGKWVPLKLSSLAEAINLHQKALLHGVEIFVFPKDASQLNLPAA